MKKTWEAPKLIILVRSKPEEAILVGCKNDAVAIGMLQSDSSCERVISALCSPCDNVAGS